MSDVSSAAWLWLAKGAGATAGSAISLAYMLPHGRREAALRFAVGAVTGIVFGTTVGVKIASELGVIEHLNAVEISLMGAAAASLSAWWALGMLVRLATRYANGAAPISPSDKSTKE